jgi:hypothetical protein
VFGLKTKFRVLVGAAAFVVLTMFALSPAMAAPAGSYSGVADGTALSVSLSAPGGDPILSVDAGITHAEVDSTPHAAGSGAGVVQLPQTVAETDAPPDDTRSAELLSQVIGDPSTAGLEIGIARGNSTSETSGDPSSTNVGELLAVNLNLANLLGTEDFAVRSTSDVVVDGQLVTATGHSDEVVITLKLGDDLVTPVCDLLDALPLGLGEACDSAVGQVSALTTVITIRILPATVSCVYDGNTGLASVPTAEAALLTVQLFDAEPITVSAGQTIDLLAGTPLHIHAIVTDVSTSVDGNEASARASGLVLELFEDVLPQVRLAASDVSCGVSGELPVEPPPVPRTPVTGGALPPIMLGAAALVLVGLGARRFAKVA